MNSTATANGNPRKLALRVLVGVYAKGQSTGKTLPTAQRQCANRDRGLLTQLVIGSLQHWFGLQAEINSYLQKPLKQKDADISCLLVLGLFQLRHTRIPPHAAISETVNLCPKHKRWARGLCNAVLRKASTRDAPAAIPELPSWLQQRIAEGWPEHVGTILEGSQQLAPLTLRCLGDREAVQQRLADEGLVTKAHAIARSALIAESSQDISQLPSFSAGLFTVQDAAAQLAAELLAPQNQDRILDACAAPGGKTTHLLQLAPGAKVTALDSEADRLQRVYENLQRLNMSANVLTGDASQPQAWWDGEQYDRILLDAPCSATGVIRRHPDIKLLRRESDIAALVQLQASILDALWPLLKEGGQLLYCTCSILADENARQIEHFLSRQHNARVLTIDAPWGIAASVGRQILPSQDGMDGFYYCRLQKTHANEPLVLK